MTRETNTFTKRGIDYPIVDGARTLPGKYYHSPEIYREELDKIFYRLWQYACRAEEISTPGDFKLIEIGDESLILVRIGSAEIKAHFNVCRHRGTQLCTDEQGHFDSGLIQCPYHAWTYELDGTLKRAPLMTEGNGFIKNECNLFAAHVHNWEGFVFVSLAKDPEPFEVQMDVLMGRFKEWRMADLRVAHHIRYELNCNWKLILQNYQECYHCPGVHPLLSQHTPVQSARHDASKGAVIGGYMDLTKERGSMTMDGNAAAPPVHDVGPEHYQRIYYYSVFPNMLLTPHPDFVLFHHIRPLGPGKITNDCYWLFEPRLFDDPAARLRIQSAVDFWDLTNRQDWQVCEQMQVGTKSQRFDRGYYSGREDVLYALDREVLRALGHADPELNEAW